MDYNPCINNSYPWYCFWPAISGNTEDIGLYLLHNAKGNPELKF